MKARYCSASARIEILARSTFCWRASASSRSSGPSKPSTSTTSAGSSDAALGQFGFERLSVSLMRRSAPPSSRQTRAGRPARSMPVGGRARRQRRRGAPRGLAGKLAAPRAATARISSSLPLQCSTRSQPAASAARVRSAIEPESAPIETSSLINSPSNPMKPRITSRIIVAEVVAGSTGSMAVKTTCAVIPNGKFFSGRNAAKSVASSVARSACTTGSCSWLSAVARPWPGMCLSTGSTPPSMQALGDGGGDGRDLVRRLAIGAVADHGVGAARPAHRRAAGSRR